MLKLLRVLIHMFRKENYADMFSGRKPNYKVDTSDNDTDSDTNKDPNYSSKDSDPDKTESYTSEEEIVVTKT